MTCKICNDTGIDPIFGASRCWHCPKDEAKSVYTRFELNDVRGVTHIEICPEMSKYIVDIKLHCHIAHVRYMLTVDLKAPGKESAAYGKWYYSRPSSGKIAEVFRELSYKYETPGTWKVSYRVESKVLILTELP